MYTISSDSENNIHYVMLDGIDVAMFNSLEEAQNYIDNA